MGETVETRETGEEFDLFKRRNPPDSFGKNYSVGAGGVTV